ncbi:MAG TPA: four helix bundle protein [Candidatus Acidoferrum sp.]|nr:four helix bundle protein [Candidatus Acidoferrum sp.]
MKNGEHSTCNVQRSTPETSAGAVWEFNEGSGGKREFDLEDRLLESASASIDLSEMLPDTRSGNHVAGQILRSGTSPDPNHAEAEAAESRDDFIHKLKVCLKELRETRRWERLIKRKGWTMEEPTLLFVLSESDELIRIFHSSIQTAERNAASKRQKPSGAAQNPADEAG